MLSGEQLTYAWNWAGAENALRKAEELEPDSTLGNYGTFLRCMGKLSEARAKTEKWLKLAPKASMPNSQMVHQLRLEGKYAEAVTAGERLHDLIPGKWIFHLLEAMTFYEMGLLERAEEKLQAALRIDHNPEVLSWLGAVHAESGRTAEARAVLRQLEMRSGYVNPYFPAAIHATLGDKDLAFQSLEKAREDRSEMLINSEYGGLHTDPRLKKIRDDPRFVNLVQRVGLPPWPDHR